MKSVLLLFSFIILLGCTNSNEVSKPPSKSNLEIAKEYVDNFKPLQAITYLQNIPKTDKDYDEAQRMLEVIINTYKSNNSDKNSNVVVENKISKEDSIKLVKVQNKWAKSQVQNSDGMFARYRLESLSRIIFILSKEASESGVSISVGEENNVPLMKDSYNQMLSENALSNSTIEIKFESNQGTSSNANVSSSSSSSMPEDIGIVRVRRYIKDNLDMNDSYEDINWTRMARTKNGYKIRHTFKMENAYGQMAKYSYVFYLNESGWDVLDYAE